MQSEPTYAFGEVLKTFRQRRRLTQVQLATALGVHRHTIGSWEQGEYLPESKGMVLELARLLRLTNQEARQLLEASLTALSPPWYVPFQRNPFFTGREALLETVHTRLSTTSTMALTHAYALHGLGGIGKTQLALEYAYRYALDYTAVFWINAESSGQISSSFVAIAEVLQVPERAEAEQQRAVTAVQRWLNRHSGWLLIWDNVEDLELLPRFLPSARESTSLLTTRRQALGTLAEGIEVAPLPAEEALLFLLRRARLFPAAATPLAVARLAEKRPAEYEAAKALVQQLDGLPLALDQAGAYLEETGCRLSGYLQRYQQQRGALLARRGGPGAEHPHSVVTTFALAKARLEQDYQAAGDLLRGCAYLSAEGIPEELFEDLLRERAPALGPAAEGMRGDAAQFDLALAALRRLSLIERQAEVRTCSLHRLVQVVVQEGMSESERHEWQHITLRLLNARFPQVTPDVWSQCERLLPHVLTCVAAVPDQAEEPALAELLRKAADYLRDRAQYEQAEPLYQRALRLNEQARGPGDAEVAAVLNGFARLSFEQGKYEQAEPLYQRALRIYEHLLGLEHPDMAPPLKNLADLYYHQGKYEPAEPLYQRALSLREQELGPDHPEVALSLNNLADLYVEQGKYEQAEPLYQRALHIGEQELGPDHPEVACALTGLADLACEQGQAEQAEALYQRAVHIGEQELGPDHPLVAAPLHGLANLYYHQGKYEQAEALYQRALAIREQRLGPDHPETAETLAGLAALCWKQNHLMEAHRLYQRALSIQAQRLGSTHPHTRQTRAQFDRLDAQLEQTADPA